MRKKKEDGSFLEIRFTEFSLLNLMGYAPQKIFPPAPIPPKSVQSRFLDRPKFYFRLQKSIF